MRQLRPQRPVILQGGILTLHDREIHYNIKQSYRARYARLEIRSETGLTVIIPRKYRIENVSEFLKRKSRWIINTLDRHSVTSPRKHRGLKSGDTVPYLGRNIEIVVQPMCEKYVQLSMLGDRLLIDGRIKPGDSDRTLEMWYRLQAESLFHRKLEEASNLLGIRYGRLSIRGQKTRWGSCSRMGTISLNWKLIMVPEPVIDYVIIHELAHIKEMNHSGKFWQLVARYCPQWQEHRTWLRDHLIENFNIAST